MPLRPGQSFAYSVIAGRHKGGRQLGDNRFLEVVLQILYEHHNKGPFGIKPNSLRAYTTAEETSWLVGESSHGTIVRVTGGVGLILIAKDRANRPVELQAGDWAYIPGGVVYKLACASLEKRLRFVTAGLQAV